MIFEYMINCEAVRPEKLAYDRPSEKLIAFLGRHYDLKNYVPQNNNYVVFQKYFQDGPATNHQSNSDKGQKKQEVSFGPTSQLAPHRQSSYNSNAPLSTYSSGPGQHDFPPAYV